MKDHVQAVPGFDAEVPETTLGISHSREEAGSVAQLTLGGSLPVTTVDQTTIEKVSTDAPGIKD